MNYHASSKGMEADAAFLSLVMKLDKDYDSKLYIENFVTDDDSSIRALLSHPTTNPKGRLPTHIPEPCWLADPSHRTRVVARAIFALATLNLEQSECRKIDAMRF